jgi:hypothetical protein
MNTFPRFIAVFPKAKQVPQYLTDCRLVVTMMTGNANLPNPTPPLAQVSAHLDILEASEALAHKGGKGAVPQRNVELGVVRNDMRLLKAYVQSVADASATESESIIKSVGMDVGKKRARTKPPVGANQGKVPGSVVLEARALPRPVQYRWQMSTDQQTWTDLPESFKAMTTVFGLTAATVYYFRLRTITKDGPSDWSMVVSIIVH